MGRTGSTRVTSKQVMVFANRTGGDRSSGVSAMIKQLLKKMTDAAREEQEQAVGMLASLAEQNRNEHTDALFKAGAIAPLVQLLTSGGAKSQAAASHALQAMMHGKPAHQKAMVLAGIVAPLVKLLKTGSAKVQEVAASALASLDADVAYQGDMIQAGCIPPLVAMLKGASVAGQAFASQALANAATFDAELGQDAVVNAGAIPLLLVLLSVGKAQTPAAHALAQLARNNAQNQRVIADAGGIAPLLSLLNGRYLEAQMEAAFALAELARDNSDTQDAIAKAGGIGPLLALLSSRSSIAQSKGMAALAHLARGNIANQDAIAAMGGIKPLVQLLETLGAEYDVQAHAAFALMEITRGNRTNQKLVVQHDGIDQLASVMKRSTQDSVRAEVAGALWSMAEMPENKRAIAKAEALQPLVMLLGSALDERATKHAAEALVALALDNESNQVHVTTMLIELLSNGTREAQERAVAALWQMVDQNPSAHEVIAKAGDPKALVELFKGGIDESKYYATWSLSLSISLETQSIVAESGGIQPLIDQLSDGRVVAREQAAAALAKLASNNEETSSTITKQGGIAPLIALLKDSSASESSNVGAEKILQNAADALANLAVEPTTHDEIVGAGGIDPLVHLLLTGKEAATKRHASTALARLSKDHDSTKLAIAEAGAIAPLVGLLDGSEGPEAQQEAAGALFELADNESNRLAITSADGIGWLVQLLASNNPVGRKHAEGALVRLSVATSNRSIIIEKLVDMLRSNADLTGQEQSAAALANLARESDNNRASIVRANGIPLLLALIDAESGKCKENAISALTELCRNTAENRVVIADANGITKLVGVLLQFSSAVKDVSQVPLFTLAAEAVSSLAKGNAKNQNSIAEAGAILYLVAMLGSPAAQMQANAAAALANLARNHHDNQVAIAKAGAVPPLCTLVKEGSSDAKDRGASALWSLATDNAANKDTIAKLGGIDPLIQLLTTSTTDRSLDCVSGALCSLAAKNPDNRTFIAKRLAALLVSAAARTGTGGDSRALRSLSACATFANDSSSNQTALAKAGAFQPLITLTTPALNAQSESAEVLLCISKDNAAAQSMLWKATDGKLGGIPALVALIKKSSPDAMDYAARTMWHLASQPEIQQPIAEANSVKPLVSMLSSEENEAAELAAVVMVRLMRGTDISVSIAEKGGIVPLVKLLQIGSPGAAQQGAAALAELALVPAIRDAIVNAGSIKPLIRLLSSDIVDTPETAARVLGNLAIGDPTDKGGTHEGSAAPAPAVRIPGGLGGNGVHGCDERRMMIHVEGGIRSLLSMLDGTNVSGEPTKLPGIRLAVENTSVGMKEQAAATIANLAHNSADMQDAIIEAGVVPSLLAVIRTGSRLGQQHAARAIRNLVTRIPIDMALIENQHEIVSHGAIPDLVQLTKTGSQKAQEIAAAGISELASGAVFEREAKKAAMGRSTTPPPNSEDGEQKDRLQLISEAGGIVPLVTMLTADNNLARENAAGALMHLALDPANAVAIAKANGIAPLVNTLEDGTETAHKHAAEAILRLSVDSPENQMYAAKPLVALLASPSTGAQCRTARVLSDLAANNEGAPVIIVNAGAISPLVALLTAGLDVKREVAGALKNLSLNSPSTQLAIATGLVSLLDTSTPETQEHITMLLLTLVRDEVNCAAVSRTPAIPRMVTQLTGGGNITLQAQELAAAVLAKLSAASESNVDKISEAGGTNPLISLLDAASPPAQANIASVLSDLAKRSTAIKDVLINQGAIGALVDILKKEQDVDATPDVIREEVTAKAEATGALLCISNDNTLAKKDIHDVGGVELIVALLDQDDSNARIKAAGAIRALCAACRENQDSVRSNGGIVKLVGLLDPAVKDDVQGEVASALESMCGRDVGSINQNNQEMIADAGGIEPLVALLHEDRSEHAKEQGASALWSLATKSFDNQVRIASAGGIAPLVAVLGLGSSAQELAGGALAALALDNPDNQASIATLIVSSLGSSDDRQTSAKATRAISRMARETFSNQAAIAEAGGTSVLVRLLLEETADQGSKALVAISSKASTGSDAIVKEISTAIWSMAASNPENQTSFASEGGIPLLVALLTGSKPDLLRVAAGAIWSLTGNPGHSDNQLAVADAGGIVPLVTLLKMNAPEVHETVAGALCALAQAAANRVAISAAGGIPLLVGVLDGAGSEACKSEASHAMQNLVIDNQPNQRSVAEALVASLRRETITMSGKEHVSELLRDLCEHGDNRHAIAKAGTIPLLVLQLENGSERAIVSAAKALSLIALRSPEHRPAVTQDLVVLLGSKDEMVRQRASDTLRGLAVEERPAARRRLAPFTGGPQKAAELVTLLKDGLKDGRVEAQEYALRSLSVVNDQESRAAIVAAGIMQPLIQAVQGVWLGMQAQEHATIVLAALSLIKDNAKSIKSVGGVTPLVRLLSEGSLETKKHAALTLAQLARHADAADEISEKGGVSAFIEWLYEPQKGPQDVAADALSEIALDSAGTQVQIGEEGAIPPLVELVKAWVKAQAEGAKGNQVIRASSIMECLRLATIAARTIAVLARDNVQNQVRVTEEEGIPPLLALLVDRTGKAHENATRAIWHLSQLRENQALVPRAGGVKSIIALLSSDNEMTQQYAAAALESLALDHTSNQITIARMGAIEPLVDLLSSQAMETQDHAAGTLLHLASQDKPSRDAVIVRLVEVLDTRHYSAQAQAAKVLALLSSRSHDNRVAITGAKAIGPLVNLLGDGRAVKADTPQERAAAVLASLARIGENKATIIACGGAAPLVEILSSDSSRAQANAASALWQLASLESNKPAIVKAGGIVPLTAILTGGQSDAQKFAMGALWHLAGTDRNKAAIVSAGAIPRLVEMLHSDADEAREKAVAVLSTLARTQGGNKQAIFMAGAINPLIKLLRDPSVSTQKNAASALWSLADGKEGIYDKHMVDEGAVEPLIEMLLHNNPDTRGFAAACMSCLCADKDARRSIIEGGGADPLLTLLYSPNTWLRSQAMDMLRLLGIPFTAPEQGQAVSPRFVSPRQDGSGSSSGMLVSPPMVAKKILPIRKHKEIDPNKENPKVGELQAGDKVFIVERREVQPGTWRALISLELRKEAHGWVTAARNGLDFLVPDLSSHTGNAASKKFNFFPHQMKTTIHAQNGLSCVHFT